MILINFLKSIIPGILSAAGLIFSILAKIVEGFSVIFYSLSVTLHMLFETEEGKRLKQIEKTTQSIINMYNNVSKKIEAQKSSASAEENRLAKILKDNKNVLPLGKKDDDTPKS